MYRTYYTLRKSKEGLGPETYGGKFDSYEDAYDFMCLIYINEKNKHIPHTRYGIYRTSENDYGGTFNSTTQPVWE